ncbi:predicted protein [Naegleria gruberi]|uniref:Predicted protein n=1 Tax=Naegleria gruberi TaxID=5762 RepID=D2W0R7_NAEGR|nr:uncharacterized protein NAEGRDRAFT_74955 [Naegleria gruberi]EFC37383.1 predicted protein [Naegleria gruberi]|eukprot:XP_002670127.1 predicted protein [Naegleria gruberi strain NEG-M]
MLNTDRVFTSLRSINLVLIGAVLLIMLMMMNASTCLGISAGKGKLNSKLWKITKLAATTTNATTAWPQIGFDSMHTRRVPYLVDHSDFATNLSVPFLHDNSYSYNSVIFHTGLQKLIMPVGQVYSKPNVQIIYLVGFYLIDVKSGKAEKTPFQLEQRYSMENNLLLDSKGMLYVPVYDNLNRSGTSLLKINTNDWTSFSITPLTPSYQQVSSIISEENNCLVFLASKWLSCIDLDNPKNVKWNITTPEEPYGASQMLMAREKDQDFIYVSLMHYIMKISVSSGKVINSVSIGTYFLSSINHMGVDGFLSFSFSNPTHFGVMHVDSGNYNSVPHFGIVGVGFMVSLTYLDHSLLSSYVFKTVVFSSEARTTSRAIHIYTTLVHVSSDTSVKISKPFAFFGTDLNTSYEVPRASIAKDNSKLVYYTNGSYSVFDISKGKVEKVVPSKWNFGYANIITADNGRVYSMVENANLGLESYKLQ